MTDVPINSDEESPYECFSCGNIELAESQPVACPDCAGEMRNRRTPLE
jgi:Zn finger protein HypA/HybF involved in hydrogenase expression